ncbi:Omega-hydroxypalmitate O-feruloyl transferase [Quillaja saponaria]|uniref:Omega-hydroxypalmitate O-feruloyl transferase n=1 Tax=Quillaja saponaria TaxID=32244 RepID=A0AAD7PNB2_QUISA|nr:Omega-hydroxypalmitate O-feruloyl transferase [Quillaja saponaria]
MEGIELVEKAVITPEKSTTQGQIFLSNIDLGLVVYQESVTFFDPPSNQMSFSEAFNRLCHALRRLLVPYAFLAGRLVPSLDENHRFEIDCNGAGVLVAAAKTHRKLSEFGDLLAPKPDFRQFVAFVLQEGEEDIDLKDKPLLCIQLTQFGCGSLALAPYYNHCTLDGVSVRDFESNLAAFTRGDDLTILPKPDRTALKARNPPKLQNYGRHGALHQRWQRRKFQQCCFHVDARKIISPQLPDGFSGNALIPGFARATVKELTEDEDSSHIRKVQEGIERLDDEYVRSGIDWLEVNRGVPRREDSFSLVAWWRLGLDEQLFAWGRVKCAIPVVVKPGLVMLLPGPKNEGGLSVCLELPEDHMEEFSKIMMEE